MSSPIFAMRACAQGRRTADARLVDETIAALTASSVACRGLVERLAAVTISRDGDVRRRCSSTSSSTRRASSSRSGTASRTAASIPACYDLLASEARLTSFIAIAKGDVPASHWFRLGRPMTPVAHGAALRLLVRLDVRVPDAGAGHARAGGQPAVARPVASSSAADGAMARRRACPGGSRSPPTTCATSSSPTSTRTSGCPASGSSEASATSSSSRPMRPRSPRWSSRRPRRTTCGASRSVGARGSYGFYEALDYTGARRPEGAKVAVVRAYMAHHQGMTLVALSNVLRAGVMRARFHAEPIIQATELLLAGAPAPRRRRRPAAGRGGRGAGPRARVRRADLSPVHVAPRSDSPDASALQRALCR